MSGPSSATVSVSLVGMSLPPRHQDKILHCTAAFVPRSEDMPVWYDFSESLLVYGCRDQGVGKLGEDGQG
jgi:hypothetical protein